MTECETYQFHDDGSIPNNKEFPLLLYRNALSEELLEPEACIEMLAEHGWTNAWVNGIFPYHHYHSNAHEVLAVIGGSAQVMMGGPKGEQVELNAGDLVLIPAGVGHCKQSSSGDFQVVGAYDHGLNYDLRTGEKGERPSVLRNIELVPLPEKDPVTGGKKPLYDHWIPTVG